MSKKRQRIAEETEPLLHPVRTWGTQGRDNAHLWHPTDIAIGPLSNNVYVLDNSSIKCFTACGVYQFSWHSQNPSSWTSMAVGRASGSLHQVAIILNTIPGILALPPGVVDLCAGYAQWEHIYVTNTTRWLLEVFRHDGAETHQWKISTRDIGVRCSIGPCEYVHVSHIERNCFEVFMSDDIPSYSFIPIPTYQSNPLFIAGGVEPNSPYPRFILFGSRDHRYHVVRFRGVQPVYRVPIGMLVGGTVVSQGDFFYILNPSTYSITVCRITDGATVCILTANSLNLSAFQPMGLTIGRDDQMYVTDWASSRIVVLTIYQA